MMDCYSSISLATVLSQILGGKILMGPKNKLMSFSGQCKRMDGRTEDGWMLVCMYGCLFVCMFVFVYFINPRGKQFPSGINKIFIESMQILIFENYKQSPQQMSLLPASWLLIGR